MSEPAVLQVSESIVLPPTIRAVTPVEVKAKEKEPRLLPALSAALLVVTSSVKSAPTPDSAKGDWIGDILRVPRRVRRAPPIICGDQLNRLPPDMLDIDRTIVRLDPEATRAVYEAKLQIANAILARDATPHELGSIEAIICREEVVSARMLAVYTRNVESDGRIIVTKGHLAVLAAIAAGLPELEVLVRYATMSEVLLDTVEDQCSPDQVELPMEERVEYAWALVNDTVWSKRSAPWIARMVGIKDSRTLKGHLLAKHGHTFPKVSETADGQIYDTSKHARKVTGNSLLPPDPLAPPPPGWNDVKDEGLEYPGEARLFWKVTVPEKVGVRMQDRQKGA